jgi:putative glutamine amidotransferase
MSVMRPLIGIPARFSDKADTWRVPAYSAGRTYCDAIIRAGGVPVIVTPDPEAVGALPDVILRLDGIVLLGGPDIDPARYGATERHDTLYGVRAEHDENDLTLARLAIEHGKPLLAICRGHQALNVALGGTLHQHITDDETTVAHRFAMHEVTVAPGSRLFDIVGSRPNGHSVHHQAIDRLGSGLVATAYADDATIEAVELPDQWVVGVQWHPEDTAATDPVQQALFDALVTVCRV